MGEFVQIYNHFSTTLSIIRLSIVTVIVGSVLYVYNIPPFVVGSGSSPVYHKDRHDFILLWLPLAVGWFWTLENGYYKKFNQNVLNARQNTESNPFFKSYIPLTHKFVYGSYLVVILRLLWLTPTNFPWSWHFWATVFFLIIAIMQMIDVIMLWCYRSSPEIPVFWKRLKAIILLEFEVRD